MRKLLFFFVIFLLSAPLAYGQSYLEYMRQDVKTNKIEAITKNMNFTPQQDAVIWPLYREYQFELDKINDQKAILINQYLQNRGDMTDKTAKSLVKTSFKLQNQRIKLLQRYYKRFEKVLTPSVASKLLQLENQLNLMIDLQISQNLFVVK